MRASGTAAAWTVNDALCTAWACMAAAALLGCGRESFVYLGRDDKSQGVDVPDAAQPVMPRLEPDGGGNLPATAGSSSPPPTPPPCGVGLADCDGDSSNGCETDLRSSVLHCGGCGTGCTQPGCVCENGNRTLRCPDGLMDCDLDLENGCESDVSSDLERCGACDRACPRGGPGVSAVGCTGGACVLTCTPSTLAPFGDCDGNLDNGCEAPLWADPSNCGTCGMSCRACDDGACL